ncbi:glycosyltransferase family 39 protein [Labilibacter marinus]|uniref:glycosyltransferase family 39 protein n=1 Tax=Labilibacter marinus TaxID=1477105 RepID=UPI00094F5DE7|nr:glycosyltransferase family 39 protein [Labilibacter marinus]
MTKKNQPETKDTVSNAEAWLKSNANIVFYFLLGVYTLFSFLYFNVKPSIAGDDSSYIISAINFLDSGRFPTYQGPLYPILLSLIISITGMNIVALKLTSTLFMIAFVIIFYRSFKDRISYISLFYTIALLSISNYFLFFSSQTFTEALFIMLQASLFLILFKNINDKDKKWKPAKREIIYLVSTTFLCTLMFLTRTIGFGAPLALVIFYLFQKNYQRATYTTVLFAIFLSLFFVVRTNIWDAPVKSGKQTSQLLNKDPYDASKGQESAVGFLVRFKDNSNQYLSKHFMRFIGVRSIKKNTQKPTITLILYALFILGFIIHYRKNNFLLFTGIYLAIMLGITFFSLQKLWDQYRLIIPFIPLILIFLSESVLAYGEKHKLKYVTKVFPLILLLSLALAAGKGIKTIDLTTLSKNIRGDKLAGYTPDWISYLTMAEYCHKNLKEDELVACRKPNMARIYGKGKKFHGIYRIPANEPDALIAYLKEREVSHIMLASLRKNPYAYTGQTINTIQRFMSVIVKKYPKSFKLVKKFGEHEPTYLFKIDYNVLTQENEK